MRTPAMKLNVFTPRRSAAAVALAGLTAAPFASANITDVDALQLQVRPIQWNQYPTSTLSVNGTPEGSVPSAIAIGNEVPGEFLRLEENPLGQFDNGGSGELFRANSHFAWLSSDGGSTRHPLDFQAGFDISVDINLNSPVSSPRLEAGFFFLTGTGSDTQFIIKTFNDVPGVNDSSIGEIAAFAGPLPKASNLAGQGPAGLEWEGLEYNAGDTATLRMQYLPPVLDEDTGAVIDPATMQYWYNDVAAYDEPEPFGDTGLAFLPPNTKLALKMQVQSQVPQGVVDTVTNPLFVFSNLVISDPLAGGILGDYNNSGQVEQGDLDLVLQNWGLDTDANGVPTGWTNDLPSGQIEQTELDGVLQNWGNTAAPNFSGSSVPEPGTLAGLTAAVLGVCGFRRRQQLSR